MIESPVWLVLVILAVARVAMFVVDDRLTLEIREWAVRKYGVNSKRAYLLHCHWCVSVWASALVVPYGYFGAGHWWAQIPITVAAVSLVAPALLHIKELVPKIELNKDGEPWR